MFLGFNERSDQLLDKARRFGMPLGEGTQSDLLSIRTFAPVDVEPDEISTVIRHEVASRGIRRLVIDATFEIERTTTREDRPYDYFGALVTYLRDAGVTVCMTKLINKFGVDELDFSNTPMSVVAENLLLLHQIEYPAKIRRIITVLKMRDSDYDQHAYEYVIGSTGLTIKGRFERAGMFGHSPGALSNSNAQLLEQLDVPSTTDVEGQPPRAL